MSQALSTLLGGPTNFDVGLQFNQWVDKLLPRSDPTSPT